MKLAVLTNAETGQPMLVNLANVTQIVWDVKLSRSVIWFIVPHSGPTFVKETLEEIAELTGTLELAELE